LAQDLAIQALKAFNNAYEILNEIQILIKSKKGEWKVLGSKKTEMVERKFKEALEGTKNAIESNIWFGKGFAIAADCGSKVDKEFHDLMGLLIMKFNDIHMRLDVEKLDERLVEHLKSQLKILADYAQHFWNIQGSSSHQNKEEDAMKIIEDFRSRLWDFTGIMGPYLKSEEIKKVV
jgi:hypothetical protein